jgi:hypothetical protein
MIIDNNGERITADQAGRKLVHSFGEQLGSMDYTEWGWVVEPVKLTKRERELIYHAINKHGHRVHRFLFPRKRAK